MVRAARAGLKECYFRISDGITSEKMELLANIFRADYPELWHWFIES